MTEKRRHCVRSMEIEGLCVGRKNEKFMPFIICTFHLHKVTSRKVGKL
jgi:hypothetical protein